MIFFVQLQPNENYLTIDNYYTSKLNLLINLFNYFDNVDDKNTVNTGVTKFKPKQTWKDYSVSLIKKIFTST